MIQKVLIFNYTGWNQTAASLTEGLKLNKNLKLFSTTKSCYGSDIVINSELTYHVEHVLEEGPPSLYTSSIVCDTQQYISECEGLMDECDLVVIYNNNNKISTAHFHKKDGINTDLHEYALRYYRDKVVMIDPGDQPSMEYGEYGVGDPSYFKVYFKREKSLSAQWLDNVEPMPFAAEERYFTSGKNFDKMWKNKSLNVSCLFRTTTHLDRPNIKEVIGKRYENNNTFVLNNTFGRNKNDDMDEQLEGTDTGECVRHHHNYFDILSKVKINIEGQPGHGAFYTGRMMESLANGCCYFYPPPSYNVDFPNGLIDGKDFIIYHNAEDLIEKIDYYLSHEDEMKSIAENGFNKLLKYHTSEVRAKEFIETCERYMYD